MLIETPISTPRAALPMMPPAADAELLALGDQFAVALAAYLARVETLKLAWDAQHAETAHRKCVDDVWRETYARIVEGPEDEAEEACLAVSALTGRIRGIDATTIAGFAIKTRALHFDLCKWWTEPCGEERLGVG